MISVKLVVSILSAHNNSKFPGKKIQFAIPITRIDIVKVAVFLASRSHSGAMRYRIAKSDNTPGVNGSKDVERIY